MPAPRPFTITRKELATLAARLDRLANIFRRKSDAAPVALAGQLCQAIAEDRFAVRDEPEEQPELSRASHASS